MKSSVRYLLMSLAALSIASQQNCAPEMVPSQYRSLSSESSFSSVQGKPVLGDRVYIESVFRNVFLTANSSAEEKFQLEYAFITELSPAASVLGRACDPYKDGDVIGCYYTLSNAKLQMSAATSAVREAARAQICRAIINRDEYLNNVKANINSSAIVPDRNAARAIVQLFYPAVEGAELENLLEPLMALDKEMAFSVENAKDRWRMMVLTVCESEGWTLL